MAFEPIYETIKSDDRRWINGTPTTLSAVMHPPMGTGIVKVLSYDVSAVVLGGEAFTGEARYEGRADFTVLFVTDNGSVDKASESVSFSGKIASNSVTAGSPLVFHAETQEVSVAQATSGELRLSASVGVCVAATESKSVKALSSALGAYPRYGMAEFTALVCSDVKKLEVECEIPFHGAVKLIKSSSVAVLSRVEAMQDCVRVRGEVIINLIGLNANGLPVAARFVKELDEEVAALGSLANMEALAKATVTSKEAQAFEGENGTCVKFSAEVEIAYSVFGLGATSVALDLFCLDKELSYKRERFDFSKKVGFSQFCDTLDGAVSLSEGMPDIDSVACCDGFSLLVTGSRLEGKSLTVEGLVTGSVLYLSDYGETVNSLSVNLPFVTETTVDREVTSASVFGVIKSVSCRARRGSELEIRAEASFCVECFGSVGLDLITGVTEGEAIPMRDTAMVVHIGYRGEELWEVARAMRCAPNEIAEQNAALEFPLSGGERVLLYRKISR